jgi:AcrR family transcriptional regulator
VSHTAPYRHFADKDCLLAAVAEDGFNGLTQVLTRAMNLDQALPCKALAAGGMAYVEYAIAHASNYRVMFGAHRKEHDRFPQLVQASEESFGVLVNLISEGQATGVFRSGAPDQLAKVVWSVMHGLVMLIIDQQIKVEEIGDIPELVKFMTRSLLAGIAQ